MQQEQEYKIRVGTHIIDLAYKLEEKYNVCQLENYDKTVRGKVFSSESGVVLTFIYGRFVLSVALDVLGEPLIKLFMGIKQRRHDEVQQGPQLRDSNSTHLLTVVSRTHQLTQTHTRCSPQPSCFGWVSQWAAVCFDTGTAGGFSTERWKQKQWLVI